MADIGQQQTNHVSAETAQAPPQRKKLNLKPRNPDAAARIEKERQQSSGKVCWLGVGKGTRASLESVVAKHSLLCNCRGRFGHREP
jgi:hypothetical protein